MLGARAAPDHHHHRLQLSEIDWTAVRKAHLGPRCIRVFRGRTLRDSRSAFRSRVANQLFYRSALDWRRELPKAERAAWFPRRPFSTKTCGSRQVRKGPPGVPVSRPTGRDSQL